MRARLLSLALITSALAVLTACGDDDGATSRDAAPSRDTGATDLGPPSDGGPLPDAGPAEDAGPAPDAGPAEDAGPLPPDAAPPADMGAAPDAGPGVDAGPMACGTDGLGDFCDSMPCPSGFECMVGRCTPQARQLCGGFAGAMCTEPPYLTCLYFASADFGPCLTPAEAACLCERAPDAFASCRP